MSRSPIAMPPPACSAMRVGLLGGSFNPPHDGHRHISQTAITRLGLDKLWWVVTPGNPLKSHNGLASLDDRMVQARVVAPDPKIAISGFEAQLATAYTNETIRFLLRRYPGTRFIWIMGGDNLVQIHRWQGWLEIFNSVPILVVDRPGFRHKALSSPAAQRFAWARRPEEQLEKLILRKPPAWTYLTLPLSFASSTALREAARESK